MLLTLSRNMIGQSATNSKHLAPLFPRASRASEHILGCCGGAASCKMAECMEEFDEATPLRESYCSRLTHHEYEEQADRWAPIRIHASLEVVHLWLSCTEQALRELMEQLDTQPELYRSVLRKRRREQKEEAGLMSYLKV